MATSNQGQPVPVRKTISLASGRVILRSGIAIDAQGDLWISDAGNNRVLRFRLRRWEAARRMNIGGPGSRSGRFSKSNQIPRVSNQSQCNAVH